MMSKPNYPECERCGGEDCACCEVYIDSQQNYITYDGSNDWDQGQYDEPNDCEDDESCEDVAPLLRKMCELYAELLRVDFGPDAAWEQVYQMWVEQN